MDPIERHIKQHFDHKSFPYNEAHWLEAQKLIAEDKRKRWAWLYWWTGGVTMFLSMAFVYWTVSPESKMISSQDFVNLESHNSVDVISSESDIVRSTTERSTHNSEIISAQIQTKSTVLNGNFQNKQNRSDTRTQAVHSLITKETRSKNNSIPTDRSDDMLEKTMNNQQSSSQNTTTESDDMVKTESMKLSIEIEADNYPNTNSENSIVQEAEQLVLSESNIASSSSLDNLVASETDERSKDQVELMIVTPVKPAGRMRWGFVAGYLMQKQFIENQWLHGAYLGGRANVALSSKWSVGADLTLVVQEMKSVHFHHDVISGYGFGRDSLVTDMFAKRAVTLQIPLVVSYAMGKHTFSGMIGTRILLDAQARMQKLHYTNDDPENTAVVPRSTMVTKKEQLMPNGALSPFSIYSGLRYGWMIGRGWGLESNISLPLFHRNAKLDYGARMAADQGLRLEIGVMKVF